MTWQLEAIAAEADAAFARGGLPEACQFLSERFREALSEGEPPTAIRVLHRQALLLDDQGEPEGGEELAQLGLELARLHELRQLEARLLNYLGQLRFQRHQWVPAAELYRASLQLAHAEHDDELVAVVCMNLGTVHNVSGEFAEAYRLYLESLGAAVRCGERVRLVMTYNNLGMVCTDREDWMEALVHFDRGLEIAIELGDRRQQALLLMNRAEPLIHVGDSARAMESLREAEALARAVGYASVLADVERFRGILARRNGDLLGSLVHLDRAVDLASDPDLLLSRAEALEERGLVHLDLGRTLLARSEFDEARRIFAELGANHDSLRAADRVRALAESEE